MLKFIKKSVLKGKQARIKRKFPGVNIFLHEEMPQPSMNKMVEVSGIVQAVNALEPKISALSDTQLKEKSVEFREHIFKKAKPMNRSCRG